MSATIGELLLIVQETIRSHDPGNAFVIGPQLEDAIWKIKSSRMKDLPLQGVLRWEELLKQLDKDGRDKKSGAGE